MESLILSSARTPALKAFTSPSARTAGTGIDGLVSVGVNDGANVFPPDRRDDPIWIAPVDNLDLTDEPRVDKEVGENFVEGEALARAPTESIKLAFGFCFGSSV